MAMDQGASGVIDNPFGGETAAQWLYPSRVHDEALCRLKFVAQSGQPCGFLTGPEGSGKSQVLRRAAADLRRSGSQVCEVDLAGLNAVRLLVRLDGGLGLNGGVPADSLATWDSVLTAIEGLEHSGLRLVLALDHADQAHQDVWTLLDQLFAQSPRGMTALVAVRGMAAGPLRDFARRHAALRIELERLSADETADYIRAAFQRIGVEGTPFDPGAMRRVYELTQGEPRLVNRLCRVTVLAAAADGVAEIPAELVDAAAEEVLLA